MIFNTFLMNVGERRRQLAILRAIGTTRGQIVRMLLLESLVMGVAGTIVGSLLGLAALICSLHRHDADLFRIDPPAAHHVAAVCGGRGPRAGHLAGRRVLSRPIAGKITPIEGMRPIVSESIRKLPGTYYA